MLRTSESSRSWVMRTAMHPMPTTPTPSQTCGRHCVTTRAMRSLMRINSRDRRVSNSARQKQHSLRGELREPRSCEASQELRPPNVRVKNGTEKSRCQQCIAPIGDLAGESVCPGVRATRAIVAERDQWDRTNRFAQARL